MTPAARVTRPLGRARAALDGVGFALAAAPPLMASAWLLLRRDGEGQAAVVVSIAALASLALAGWMRGRIARRLRTVSSVLASFREGDFSIRARSPVEGGALRDVLDELNSLGDALRAHRLGEMEAWALLRKVLSEVDVVVLAFDEATTLKLANEAAARLCARAAATLLGQSAATLGLADLLEGAAPRVLKDWPTAGAGPWELRRGSFRLSGEPHALVVLADVSAALRDQEREAWRRLVRVIGHEINNSLAPIGSISGSLRAILEQAPRPQGWEEDLAGGLSIIARRSEALGRFMAGYAKLARLPAPRLAPVDVEEWVARTTALERRLDVQVLGGPRVSLMADADQLEQLLINVVKNAVEAALETRGGVRVGWTADDRAVSVSVEDDGPGVAETGNLFVPFFTTKPGGSGIGLALARQIAEAHGGEVTLGGRPDARGAIAQVRLPLRR